MKQILQKYLGLSACYGFYRGWIADFEYNKYDKDKPIKEFQYELKTEKYCIKFLRGVFNAGMYGTIGNIFAVYRLICRSEIEYYNKNPYHHIDSYSECLNTITLSPQN